MIFSYKKIKEIANLPNSITIEQITNAINTLGFEVEKVEEFGKIKGVKFGKIENIYLNPNSDNLKICEIKFNDKQRIIQTSASNVKIGMIVLGFIPGSIVNGIKYEEKIIKNIVSEGMLTSLEEIGIKKENIRTELIDKIMNYKDESLLNIDPINFLSLNDYLIEIDILSNRSDANSYFVLAMELAAFFDTTANIPSIKESNLDSDLIVNSGVAKSLVIMEAKKDFDISIQEMILLAKSGIKSINDIVDLTNLTLLMSGQPTHAYLKKDIKKDLKTKKVSGKLKIFGGKEVELKNNLVITSNSIPLSVAGIIGLEKYAVKEYDDFIIEMGVFNIKDIRESIKSVKLNNLSSSQSSKIISKGTTNFAIAFLTNRLNNFSKLVNYKNEKIKNVEYSSKMTNRVAGFNLTENKNYLNTIEKLEKLGFEFHANKVTIPLYRHDIQHQQDLDEEIFRFYGYENFRPIPTNTSCFKNSKTNNIKEQISALGYQETKTYTLISAEKNILNPFDFKNTISLETFCSKEREQIRNSLAESLLQIVEWNKKINIDKINIFSEGMINNGIFVFGLASNNKTFDELKQDVTNIINKEITFSRIDKKEFHPGVTAKILYEKKMIGWIGKVHPSINSNNAFIAEFIYPNNENYKYQYKYFDKSPLKFRDITFNLNPKEDIKSYIENIKRTNLDFVFVKDVYQKENKKNVTVRVIGNDESILEIDNKFNK